MTIERTPGTRPAAREISVALEEMGLPYKVIPVNIGAGAQMASTFLENQPRTTRSRRSWTPTVPAASASTSSRSRRDPALSRRENRQVLAEAAHPSGFRSMKWLMWQMGGFGPMPGQVPHFIALENEQDRAYGLEALHGRDAAALRRAGPPAGWPATSSPGISRSPISPSSAGPAPSAPQGRSGRLPQRQALVRDADGPPTARPRHGREAGSSPSPRSCGRELGRCRKRR